MGLRTKLFQIWQLMELTVMDMVFPDPIPEPFDEETHRLSLDDVPFSGTKDTPRSPVKQLSPPMTPITQDAMVLVISIGARARSCGLPRNPIPSITTTIDHNAPPSADLTRLLPPSQIIHIPESTDIKTRRGK